LTSFQSFLRLIILLSFFFFQFSISFSQKIVPELWGARVHDDAHVLKPETVDQLENELKAYEDSTTNQIAVLIISSLDIDELEEYSLRVAEKWKLGQKGKDNGVLLLIAVDDHQMRIEVGQGLEGALTDAQSNKIIRDKIAPEFRRGNYDAGVTVGVEGIIGAIGGEYQAEEEQPPTDYKIIFWICVLIVAVPVTIAPLLGKDRISWRWYVFLLLFQVVFVTVWARFINGLVFSTIYFFGIGFLANTLIKRVPGGKAVLKKFARRSSKSSGGRSSSSSGSSSSFSGGGGGFGGGGSSGGW